ncbi:MAG: hypothetical protein HY822_25500 [Acidobacteria bacterium]|nr:hypothetical protein [Acidobacteriota bacterium]
MSQNSFPFTRRGFVMSAAGAGAVLSAQTQPLAALSHGPAVVKKVYLSARRAGWPRPDMDLAQEIKEIEANLAGLEKRYPGRIQFVGGETLYEAAQVEPWAPSLAEVDAVLAFNMTTGAYPMLDKVVALGKPTLLFARPYAGHDWTHASAFSQLGKKADVVASSDYAELDPYVDAFNTIRHLRLSKILVVAPEGRQPKGAGYSQHFGTTFAHPPYAEIKAAFAAASAEEARAMAADYIRLAVRVVEPPRNEIEDSLRLYLGIQDLMRREKANAITIDCLGGFGRGDLPAYPCIAFSKLNDAGQYGVCECDLESTMTQLLVTSFSSKPGFVSDPVFDTSRNEVIHAHCVSATAMQGIGQPPSPYILRTHLEDHKGVSVQVLLEGKGPVTVARFCGPAKFLVSTGEATGNVDDDRGCRTKMCTKVTDARKFLRNYGMVNISGVSPSNTRDLLHRVVFYGDHTEMIERLGRLTGFQVIHEL